MALVILFQKNFPSALIHPMCMMCTQTTASETTVTSVYERLGLTGGGIMYI